MNGTDRATQPRPVRGDAGTLDGKGDAMAPRPASLSRLAAATAFLILPLAAWGAAAQGTPEPAGQLDRASPLLAPDVTELGRLVVRADCGAVHVAPDGTRAPAPDGTYTTRSGREITVEDGIARPCEPGARATGNKGGFAIGGFSPA
jgi:hypothetical protein